MAWNSLAEINSVDLADVDEDHSRPDDRIRRSIIKWEGDVVVYGARGKFSRHVSLMLLRAIQETGAKNRKVYLVSSPRWELIHTDSVAVLFVLKQRDS